MKVKKKSGQLAILDILKIEKIAEKSCEGLENVCAKELIEECGLSFYDGIKTEEIQQSLVKAAYSKIDIDCPNWTFVAARLFLYNLYHNVGKTLKTTKGAPYGHLETYIDYNVNQGMFIPGIKELYNLDSLNKAIVPERDLQFNYLGVKTLYDRYILKDLSGAKSELPQYLFMGVAMFLAQNETTSLPKGETMPNNINIARYNEYSRTRWAIQFYNILSKFEVMAATPTLSNARTPRSQLSSCFIGATPDSIEGIFDMYKEQALLSKFGGGLGSDWSLIRAQLSQIDGHLKAAGGIIPFLKIENDVALAVDQLGTRKGAIATYIEPWHADVESFLDLKKTSGEERRRAHDLFPAIWINDLFMERVANDDDWSLFDPYDVPGLKEAYGDDFYQKYRKYEDNKSIKRETIKAKFLWKRILKEYFETGTPFLGFKDAANRANPNKHKGVIRSSNLCTEIFQNTSPNEYKIKVDFYDGSSEVFDENETVTTDAGIEKRAAKLGMMDRINGKLIYFIGKETIEGETAVCNLASINLSKVNTKEDLERVIPVAIRMLDAVIDLNYYPIKKAKDTNLKSRAIGLGVMGEAQMLAEKQVMYGSKEHFELIDEVMESVSFYAIDESSRLAFEKGSYPNFKGSDWEKGIFPIDNANQNALELINREHTHDWQGLKDRVAKNGMRNGYLMAIAPTSSISILVGTTQAIEPVFGRFWREENLSGLIPATAPKLSPDTWQYYIPAYEINQEKLIHAASIRQKWIDQGQSLNIFLNIAGTSGKLLNSLYMAAWKFGLKSTYYLRSKSPEAVETDWEVEDRSQECVGCQ